MMERFPEGSFLDADRWQKINDLFFTALTLETERRSALLAELCSGDPSLLEEVLSLVAAHQRAGEFIERPAVSPDQLLHCIATRLMKGRRFGPYRVLREIGHGGMGAVYLAVRDDHQYQKLVAIKIIKTGLDMPLSLRQFYKERQILANLEHANISRLLDGGTGEDGMPYLVMEYIEGQPIDAYCDAHRLPVLERLQLFLRVGAAVQHAHREGVIHRDIKPSNILVTKNAEPKLLDFGIARLLTPTSSSSSGSATTSLARITPEYASPEEVRGEGVTEATDIYSLGVVLYELLSGRRPHRIRNRNQEEIFHAICETDPEKPSAILYTPTRGDDKDPSSLTPERISELRSDRPERLRQRLAGDLDKIVLMAIRKEPHRRYSSVEQFLEDIRRHIAGLPVGARQATLAYRSGKFLRRNKLGVIAAALLAASLATGILTTQRQARLAERERFEVERRSREATREIQGTAARARQMETEAEQIREQAKWQEQQSHARLLHRLQEILEAHDTARGLVINTSSLTFGAGRTGLSSDARERLARIAGAPLEYPDLKLRVEGYTDGSGDDAYNQALADERARVVEGYLVTQGLARRLISAIGLGSARPIASNATDLGRQRNRRVEIVLSGSFIGRRSPSWVAARAPRLRIASLNDALLRLQKPQEAASRPNLALNKQAIGSIPCNAHEGAEKAFNGSFSGGNLDKWCSDVVPAFLQIDLGSTSTVASFVVRHASAGGESPDFNTRDFDIQTSTNGTDFVTVVKTVGNTQGVTAYTIPPSSARFVRLNITVPAQQPGIKLSRIYELEVYSSANATQRNAPAATAIDVLTGR
jgi:serine/threonine protein kinase